MNNYLKEQDEFDELNMSDFVRDDSIVVSDLEQDIIAPRPTEIIIFLFKNIKKYLKKIGKKKNMFFVYYVR